MDRSPIDESACRICAVFVVREVANVNGRGATCKFYSTVTSQYITAVNKIVVPCPSLTFLKKLSIDLEENEFMH